jgi:hypothetical protein
MIQDASIEIYDLNGKMLINKKANSSIEKIILIIQCRLVKETLEKKAQRA